MAILVHKRDPVLITQRDGRGGGDLMPPWPQLGQRKMGIFRKKKTVNRTQLPSLIRLGKALERVSQEHCTSGLRAL